MASSTAAAPRHPAKPAFFFCLMPDDLLFNILCRLDEDPRDLARLGCVSTRFCQLIKSVCWKRSCKKTIPLLVEELLQAPPPACHPLPEPPGGWAALQKIHVCCPGLWHAGVLLRNLDFELDQDLDWFDEAGCSHPAFPIAVASQIFRSPDSHDPPRKKIRDYRRTTRISQALSDQGSAAGSSCLETDDTHLYSCENTGNEVSESSPCSHRCAREHGSKCNEDATCFESNCCARTEASSGIDEDNVSKNEAVLQHAKYPAADESADTAHSCISSEVGHVEEEKRTKRRVHKSKKRQRDRQHVLCHLASGSRNLSREQGNKLLANRFRADSLYICDWPGCIHAGDKRIYKLFRGVFKNFKSSHVYRNLKDMQAKPLKVGCAFCVCKSTWNMVTSFCLKRSIEFHDDGEPVVRAYVCENGHVAGAWTDRPMYTP